jgi:hypothetical protein
LFYPAVREGLNDDELVDEADDSHAGQREIIVQILSGSPDDPQYDERVAMLADHVERHVRQEREQVFNRALVPGWTCRPSAVPSPCARKSCVWSRRPCARTRWPPRTPEPGAVLPCLVLQASTAGDDKVRVCPH